MDPRRNLSKNDSKSGEKGTSSSSSSSQGPKPGSSNQSKPKASNMPTEAEDTDDEYEDTSSSDEEVVLIKPGKENYIEIPRAKGEPSPITRSLNKIPKSQLLQFWNLYNRQPEYIKEMIRLHFYRGKPVISPAPLTRFIQKMGELKSKKKDERLKRKQKQQKHKLIEPEVIEIPISSPQDMEEEDAEEDYNNLPKPKVSLVDVYETDTKLIHIDYPGNVVNPERALATMGGIADIAKVHKKIKNKIYILKVFKIYFEQLLFFKDFRQL